MLARIIVRRLAFLILVLVGLSFITFMLSHVVPADPARLYAGPRASGATVTLIRRQFGFDLPIWMQYANFLGNLKDGNFGYSLVSNRPVAVDLHDYLPATLELTLGAMVMAVAAGIPLGVIAGVWNRSWIDYGVRLLSGLGLAMPAYWLALLAQLIFFDHLRWFPADSRLDPAAIPPPRITGLYTIDSLLAGNPGLFVQSLWHLALPSVVLGFGATAVLARMVRASMIDALAQDYVRTARAKGVGRRAVIIRHVLRNALLPATTLVGLQIGSLLGGALLVENIFSWPGIGRYATAAVFALDYNAVMAVTLVAALIFVMVNLVVDVVYMVLDPRVVY